MVPAPIPRYPVISVDVHADGSGHLNVAGRHIDYPAGPIADTRAAVIRYAVELAQAMARPVRMTTTDPQGSWALGVHPDGTVTDLAAADPKAKRRKAPPARNPAPPTSVATATEADTAPQALNPSSTVMSADDPSAASHDVTESAVLTQPPPERVAALTFSTGEAVTLHGCALVGRRPIADNGEIIDQFVAIQDGSRTVSKTHFRLDWRDGALWITDRNSGNGTSIQRGDAEALQLTPWEPFALQHDDVVHIGDSTATVALPQPGRTGNS